MFAKKINKIINHYPNLSPFTIGLLSFLAFAPFNFFAINFLTIPLFFLIIKNGNNYKKVFLRGLLFGYGYFLSGIYWIAISLLVDIEKFAWLIPFALTLIPIFLALYFGLLAISFNYLSKKISPKFLYQEIILMAILWVIIESLRSTLFTGFAWNLIGYSFLFNNYLIQIVSIFGIYFLSLLAIIIALTPLYLLNHKIKFQDKIFLLIISLTIIANFIFGYCRVNHSNIQQITDRKIRIIQANIKQEIKWQEDQRYKNLLEHIELTNSKPLDQLDAVIWSETSIPYIVEDKSLIKLLKLAVPNSGVLISGGLRVQRDKDQNIEKIFNSIFTFDDQGINNFYDKHHLVPFGEYVPLQKLFSFLFIDDIVDKITGGGMGFSSGQKAKIIETQHFKFNPLICYEVIFSSEIINKSQLPDLFINLTNDAWFGNSTGPYQHLAMSQIRSVEYAMPMIRVAGTGISASIDAFGRIIKEIPLNTQAVIDVNLIKNNQYSTFYHQYQHLPLILIMIALFTVVAIKLKD